MDREDLKNLKKRYLIWLYKTAKESLDRVERKFTQLEIDGYLLKELKKLDKEKKAGKLIGEFEAYVQNKAKEGLQLKYAENGDLKPEYHFMVLRLKAVEKAIVAGFGRKFLEEVKMLYEVEMTERILKSRDH